MKLKNNIVKYKIYFVKGEIKKLDNQEKKKL